MKIVYFVCIISFLFNPCSVSCDNEQYMKSLYSHNGYLTTPSAYISDGEVSFHYSYIPQSVAISGDRNTDNWIFSTSLGLFPFLECYFSVFVEPQKNVSKSVPNFGANKFRSAGAKLKVLNESKTIVYPIVKTKSMVF